MKKLTVIAALTSALATALAYFAGYESGAEDRSRIIGDEHTKGHMFSAWTYNGGGYSGNPDIALDAIMNDKGKKETPE